MKNNPTKSPKDKAGSPTKFKEEYVRMAKVACEEGGFTDLKLAKLFNVSKATITNWKKEHPKFLASIKEGKDVWDSLTAEKCLLKRVTGFKYTETTRELSAITPNDGDPTSALIVTKKVTKLIPPDVKACEIWLCNRNPERWKKIKHVELTGKDGGKIGVEHSLDNTWKELLDTVTRDNTDELPNCPKE